jgi:hypothetical protein
MQWPPETIMLCGWLVGCQMAFFDGEVQQLKPIPVDVIDPS